MLRDKKLLLALPSLLIVAALVNLGSLTELLRGERSFKSIIYGLSKPSGEEGLQGWKLPPDTGAANARVTIEVFVHAGDPCHANTSFLGQALGRIDPARLRVKFVDGTTGKAAALRREKVKLGCDQGLAVNGKTEFKIPDPEKPGSKRTVFTAHQKDAPGSGGAPLYPILDQELKTAYKGQGLRLSREQFDQMLNTEIKRAHDALVSESGAKKAEE